MTQVIPVHKSQQQQSKINTLNHEVAQCMPPNVSKAIPLGSKDEIITLSSSGSSNTRMGFPLKFCVKRLDQLFSRTHDHFPVAILLLNATLSTSNEQRTER